MSGIDQLLEIMARLRDPEGGCAWDLEQTFETIAPYTIEEAYEVDDAIRHGDLEALCDELGDLLLQVVFHAQMASERGAFAFADVVAAISDKLVRRHPNVFGNARVDTAQEQVRAWETHKARERERGGATSVLDGVPRGLPALLRAKKLLGRAGRAGFEWPGAEHALAKVGEEAEEVRAEIVSGDREKLREELGDLLIAAAGLAHALEIDPEEALRAANTKFETRLRRLESGLAEEGRRISDAGISELLERWERIKQW